ncbi:major tail subunit [Bordetella phage vB_BbrS_PHB09]|nr:major tail subunit [Bordetella phage vB_BbrS_PHB09]
MATTKKAKYQLTQGTKLEVSTAPADDLEAAGITYADLSVTIKDPNFQGGQTTEIDVTVLASEAKEFGLGLDDNGTFAMSGHWMPDDPAQAALIAARSDKETRAFRVTFRDESTFEFLGLVTQFQWQSQLDNTISGSFNVRVSGAVKMTAAPVTP